VLKPLSRTGIVQLTVLTAALVLGGGYEARHHTCLTSLANGDFWWHLRIGLGILQTHVLPRTGLYSQSATVPWMSSSWLYEIPIALGYRLIGLRVMLFTAILFKFVVAVLVFVLAGGLRQHFWTAVVLSLIAQYLLGSLQPLPVYCSMIALTVLLIVLMQHRRAPASRALYCLPFVFLLWANLDNQVVYGVLVIFLFLATSLFDCFLGAEVSQLEHLDPHLHQIALLTAASIAATLLNPNGWHLYRIFFSQATSVANRYFPEHHSLPFRTPQDYLLLLLIMTAFLALGLRRSRDMFQIALLTLFTMLSFRSQSDSWLAVITAIAIVGNAITEDNRLTRAVFAPVSQFATAATAGAVILGILAYIYTPRGEQALLAESAVAFPIKAADYIRNQQLPQPLFNPLQWGGFLTWYLPSYPVAIDGRNDLYGPDFNVQYSKMMNADIHYSAFPPFQGARTILLEKNSLMGKAFPAIAGFKVVYDDDIAVVLLRQVQQP
jgi:hypothetical protein